MKNIEICEKMTEEWIEEFPVLNQISSGDEVFWINPKLKDSDEALQNICISGVDVKEAEDRLSRFAPYISEVFPETEK